MSCKANERHITFEEGCWTFHPNSMYHSVMLLYLQEEHVPCQCTFGSRLHEEREKANSLCECSEGSFLTSFAFLFVVHVPLLLFNCSIVSFVASRSIIVVIVASCLFLLSFYCMFSLCCS